MKRSLLSLVVLSSVFISSSLSAEGWFLRPIFGFGMLSDTSGNAEMVDGVSGNTDVDVEFGFNAGLGLGYQYNESWTAEVYWEYRSNDSETNIASQSVFNDGNYASNIFYVNGMYYLAPKADWRTYLGAGLGWVQEVDIDLERDDIERSYSGDGDIGMQFFVGVEREIAEHLEFQAEVRYGIVSGIDLEGEENAVGRITDLDYQATTVQVGLRYQF